MWNPETDACDYCNECEYFLHEYWNCPGSKEPCIDFIPLGNSKYKLVEIEVINQEINK